MICDVYATDRSDRPPSPGMLSQSVGLPGGVGGRGELSPRASACQGRRVGHKRPRVGLLRGGRHVGARVQRTLSGRHDRSPAAGGLGRSRPGVAFRKVQVGLRPHGRTHADTAEAAQHLRLVRQVPVGECLIGSLHTSRWTPCRRVWADHRSGMALLPFQGSIVAHAWFVAQRAARFACFRLSGLGMVPRHAPLDCGRTAARTEMTRRICGWWPQGTETLPGRRKTYGPMGGNPPTGVPSWECSLAATWLRWAGHMERLCHHEPDRWYGITTNGETRGG